MFPHVIGAVEIYNKYIKYTKYVFLKALHTLKTEVRILSQFFVARFVIVNGNTLF